MQIRNWLALWEPPPPSAECCTRTNRTRALGKRSRRFMRLWRAFYSRSKGFLAIPAVVTMETEMFTAWLTLTDRGLPRRYYNGVHAPATTILVATYDRAR